MAYVQTSAPAVEPVDLETVRGFLQLDDDLRDDDVLLSSLLLPTARRVAEHLTGRALITQTWRRSMDGFPCDGVIELERSPVQAVTSIDYRDEVGVWHVVPSSSYFVDIDSTPARIAPVFGQIWPLPAYGLGTVRITFVAGYGAEPETVPEGIRHWIMMRIKGLWDYRSEDVEVLRGRLEAPSFLDGLLDVYSVKTH